MIDIVEIVLTWLNHGSNWIAYAIPALIATEILYVTFIKTEPRRRKSAWVDSIALKIVALFFGVFIPFMLLMLAQIFIVTGCEIITHWKEICETIGITAIICLYFWANKKLADKYQKYIPPINWKKVRKGDKLIVAQAGTTDLVNGEVVTFIRRFYTKSDGYYLVDVKTKDFPQGRSKAEGHNEGWKDWRFDLAPPKRKKR